MLKHGDSRWRMKRYGTYQEAFQAMKRILPKVADVAINSPALDFNPPQREVKIKGQFMERPVNGKMKKIQKTKMSPWKPRLEVGEDQHHWCPHCRRPSIFQRVFSHTMLPSSKLGGVSIDSSVQRCVICGVPETMVDLRNPMSHQKWERR